MNHTCVSSKSCQQDIFYLQLHITGKCNLKCKHCYIEDDTRPSPCTLVKKDVIKILDEFQRLLGLVGARGKVYFTGGEPLLDPNLDDYIKEASSRGFITMILSNGTLLNVERLKELKKAGLQIVQISLDGIKETHDLIRGEGSFEKATHALDACHEVGLVSVVMMTISKMNSDEVGAVVKHCVEHGVTRFSFGRLVPTGHGAEMWNQVLSKEEYKEFCKGMKRITKKFKGKIDFGLHDPIWMAFNKEKGTYGCSAGKGGICVIENGDIMACRRLDMPIGNIRNISLLDAWYSDEMNKFRFRDHHSGKCGSCKKLHDCGGCRAVARAILGDPVGEDPQCFIKNVKG